MEFMLLFLTCCVVIINEAGMGGVTIIEAEMGESYYF